MLKARVGTDSAPKFVERQKQAWNKGKLIMVGLCLAGVVACAQSEAVPETPQSALERLESKIAKDAVFLMNKEGFSKTYKKLGKDQFNKANDLTHWAAIAAAERMGPCDQIAMINVSGSSTREQIFWFADCVNKQRIIVGQLQAEDAKRRFSEAG